MTSRWTFALASLSLAVLGVMAVSQGRTPKETKRIVRLAELEIDPSQLEAYRMLLQEEISTAIRVEPGVLALYAVAVKDQPEQVRLFEMYASQEAYEAHLHSPHFLRYKAASQAMVRSLRLLETTPILLGAK